MLTPLSLPPYNSRFTLDIDLADKIYKNTYEYVNMIYHGFYGGTSLQSQELNELQENIQNQLSLANILSGNWLEYPKTTIPDVENYTVHTDIFPVDPQGITLVNGTSNMLNLSKGYYLYPTEWGNIVFVSIPEQNNIFTSSGDLYTGISFSNIQPRTVSGLQTEWDILRDNNDTFSNVGCRRIQLFLDVDTTVPTTQRSQIYAVSWYPISGNVADWSAGGTNDVVQFSHVKPSVSLKNDYGTSPFPGSTFESEMAWQPGAIRRQLRMLEDNNNLSNTNIKNIIPHRYNSGTLFSDSGNGFLIWPTPQKMSQFKDDWSEVLNRIDVYKSNADGLLIANTRLLADQETIGQNNNFTITPTSYTTITSSPNYTLPSYGTPSLFSQMNGITWNSQGTAFCGPVGCGYNTDYLIWNKSAEKLMTAAFSEVFLTPFKQRYSNIVSKVRSTNYESNITLPNDGYPDINGHESYHDNLFGDSASIALYGLFNSSSDVWGISGDSNLARIPAGQPTFTWHGNPWNAFMISIQGVRSSRRGFIYNNKINNSIFVWIAPKDFKGLNTSTLVGFNNSPYWDEMVRHCALTGVEVFGFFNGLEYGQPNDVDKAKRIEQFTVINKILVDINTKLGGYTPISLDTRRISYNSEYVISGAPTIDGKFLWRVTPKRENNIVILVNGSVAIKELGEIGVWITTDTAEYPIISIQDADMHQYFSRVAFDGGRQNQHDWGAWGNKTIAMYNGNRLKSNNSPDPPQTRPFGAFFKNPNGVTSSSWHNIIYELTYPIFKWGNRSILYQFPFGGFRIENLVDGEPQYGEEGPVAGYMRFKDLYPNGGTNPSRCSARWKGMKEAFNDVINGKLFPTDTLYPPIDKPCNIVIYLPGFMGWATYREETCKYWEDFPGTDDARDTAFYQKLDSYINDIIYIQKNGESSTGVKGRLYIGIDSAAYSATPESIGAYRSISKTESSSDVAGAAYTKFGYKAKGVGWLATNGGYRTDKLELADWYVKTKLEQAGISVLAEARPASSITQISIPEVSGGVYRGNTSTPALPVTSWGNFASVESTMWTSRTYTAANEKFDEILRWPSNSFEVVHNTQNHPEGNVFNLPSKISVLVNGVTYEKRHYPDWNAIPLVYSPFYYLHTLNALVDHIKYNDKRNANVVDRTDIQLNHKNIITLETSFYANTLDIPFANNSESSTGEYYIWNKDTMGVSSYYAEPRELFEIDDFVALPPQDYTGGLWTSGITGNKAYWDNTFRGASFGEFISKIRTISSQVSPPVGVSNGVITEYANNFTPSTTYPNDIYSTNMLKDIIGVTVSDPYLLTPTSGLSADCSEIISRLSSTIKSLTGFTGSLGVTLNWQSHIADSSVTQGIKDSTGSYLLDYYGWSGSQANENTLSFALQNQWSKSRYKRANIASDLPRITSTTSEVHTPSYAFSYVYTNSELTGVTLDAWQLGQSDGGYYGPYLQQYGPAICLVYKKLKNLIGTNLNIVSSGFTFDNTHILTLKEKCLDILNEVTKYNNGLQRANWNHAPLSPHIIGPVAITDDYYITLDNTIQRPGGAGGYLGSPRAISGIVNMVSILGDDVSPLLLRKLKILVTHEVLLIVKNWKQYLSWYVNGNQSNTNQWQEPAMGLIEACIFIKDSNLLPAYNLGVALLGESLLTSLGSDGGFPEGFGYATSVTPLMDNVLLKMMSMGDTRLNTISSEWAKNHWKWYIDHLFIGNRIINYSDNSASLLPSYTYNSPYNAINMAVYTAAKYNIGGLPDPNGVYDYQPLKNLNVIYPTSTTVMSDINQIDWFKLSGLSGSSAGTALNPLSLFNHYKDSELYVWRSGRASILQTSNGSAGTTHFGIWTKGSTKKDGHVHRDAGQLSVYCGNRLVLLDCGQNYSHPNSFSVFAGQTAHNMMQIDAIPNEWPVYSGWTGCPITVNNHSATGGNISINTIGAYRGPSVIIPESSTSQTLHRGGRVKSISRGITWGLDTGTLKVTISDGVTFGTTLSPVIDISGNTEHYRWHTGSTATINAGFTFIKMSTGLGWTANWDNGKSILSILPSREIIVSGATYPNYSLTGVLEAHNVLIIKPTAAGSTFSMTTSLIITT